MILLIDNYDSFTYNLYHYIAGVSKFDIKVIRNDKITIDEIKKLPVKAIVISPGPCTPNEAGISLNIIEEFSKTLPILGICLGHQAIGQAFGGNVIRTEPMHGKVSDVYHDNKGIFQNLPSPFKSTRYHSLIVEKSSLPDCLEVTAQTKDGIIMALQHKKFNVHGLQFHPESIASEHGHQLIENFLKRV